MNTIVHRTWFSTPVHQLAVAESEGYFFIAWNSRAKVLLLATLQRRVDLPDNAPTVMLLPPVTDIMSGSVSIASVSAIPASTAV
jgi:hypothetical protein